MGIFRLVDKETVLNPESEAISQDFHNSSKTVNNDDDIVILNGSLSEIYTKALNETYAVENMTHHLAIVDGSEEREEEKECDDGLYVHIVDEEDMEKDLLETSNKVRVALDKYKGRRRIVVLEKISDCRGMMLRNYIKSIGIEVITSRKAAIETIYNYIEGRKG